MNFFLKKILIKFSCNYWPLSFCKISKNSSIFCHFRAQNGPFVLNKFFLVQKNFKKFFCTKKKKLFRTNGPFWAWKWQKMKEFFWNHYYYFYLPIGLFHCAKFKKILNSDPELWRCTNFGPKMVHLPQTKIFLENY